MEWSQESMGGNCTITMFALKYHGILQTKNKIQLCNFTVKATDTEREWGKGKPRIKTRQEKERRRAQKKDSKRLKATNQKKSSFI